jgi:stage V sporulation protein R
MSSASTLIYGSPLLMGNNTIPGLEVPKEIKAAIPHIFKVCKDFGLDYYETIVEFLTYDDISEVAAYGGFPVRYPHWQWGMEYEELSKGYEFGYHRIFEMVVNTCPCYIYCLDSNTYTDNVTVIAHALGHNDFFKNNIWFHPTSQNMMNEFGNHRSRILRYMQRWGREAVGQFIDTVLSLETLIDPAEAWTAKKYEEPVTHDSREYQFPRRLKVPDSHDYMSEWINPRDWVEQEKERIKREELKRDIGLFRDKSKNIMGFLRDHAPLKPWQSDVLAILYEEAMYFQPQRMTKVANEGWASYVDYNVMARIGMPKCGIVEYADHKARVLGGKQSQNPYKLGFELFLHIEDCWNKGRFGREYEECKDNRQKENWDKKLGLGHEKVFEVRANYDDVTMIAEFFDQEFCDRYEWYEWKKFPSSEPGVEADYKIVGRDAKKIKKLLIQRHLNGGLPDIRLVDHNGRGKGVMVLEHQWDGRTLLPKYTSESIRSVAKLWGRPVALVTKNKNEEELIYYAQPDGDHVQALKRNQDQDL